MRLLTYDPNNRPPSDSGDDDNRPTPPDGDHLAVVELIGEPRCKNDKWSCLIRLGIVGMDAKISIWIECNSDGAWSNSWRGLGKWNSFCAALNLKEGTYNDGAFYGSPLMITVKTKGEYKNVTKMWACSQSESDKAAEWLASRM